MDSNTAQENIIRTASIAAFVLARADQLALIEATGKPDAVSQGASLVNAGFTLHGIVGIVDGEVLTAANEPLDVECMFNMGRAARTFGLLLSSPATVRKEGVDCVDWLNRLYNLPDDRQQEN
jgi:hypothetical protein